MNFIFGASRFSDLVFLECKKQNINIDGFLVEPEFLATSPPVKFGQNVMSLDFAPPESKIIFGVVFENKKGPKFLRRIISRAQANRCVGRGFSNGVRDNVSVHPTAQIWSNVFVDYFTDIGSYSILRPSVHVGHDVKIGNYVYVSPSCSLGSYAEIGDDVFIGFGAKISPNCRIGRNVVVAANAQVTTSVGDNILVLPDGRMRRTNDPFRFL